MLSLKRHFSFVLKIQRLPPWENSSFKSVCQVLPWHIKARRQLRQTIDGFNLLRGPELTRFKDVPNRCLVFFKKLCGCKQRGWPSSLLQHLFNLLSFSLDGSYRHKIVPASRQVPYSFSGSLVSAFPGDAQRQRGGGYGLAWIVTRALFQSKIQWEITTSSPLPCRVKQHLLGL